MSDPRTPSSEKCEMTWEELLRRLNDSNRRAEAWYRKAADLQCELSTVQRRLASSRRAHRRRAEEGGENWRRKARQLEDQVTAMDEAHRRLMVESDGWKALSSQRFTKMQKFETDAAMLREELGRVKHDVLDAERRYYEAAQARAAAPGEPPTPVAETTDPPTTSPANEAFLKELQHLLNKHGKENGSNTPDFVLAELISECLAAFDRAVRRRDVWYHGNVCCPGRPPDAPPLAPRVPEVAGEPPTPFVDAIEEVVKLMAEEPLKAITKRLAKLEERVQNLADCYGKVLGITSELDTRLAKLEASSKSPQVTPNPANADATHPQISHIPERLRTVERRLSQHRATVDQHGARLAKLEADLPVCTAEACDNTDAIAKLREITLPKLEAEINSGLDEFCHDIDALKNDFEALDNAATSHVEKLEAKVANLEAEPRADGALAEIRQSIEASNERISRLESLIEDTADIVDRLQEGKP